MALHYTKGYRGRYVNPITYLLVGGACSLFLFNVLGTSMEEQLIEHNRNAYSTIFSAEQMSVFLKLQKQQLGYTAQIYLLISIVFAFLLRLLFWKTHFNLAETFVFVAYVFGHILLLDAILVPLFVTITKDLTFHMILTNVLFLVVTSMGAWGFYGRNWLKLLKVIIALVAVSVSIPMLIQFLLITYVLTSF